MLAFMQGHEDFGKGRVTGPDAVRSKLRLMQELADELNALGSGPTKSADKWLKCWQDWKSDVKAKYLKRKKSMAGTGGGPAPPPLSPIEESLLQFFGVEMVEGVAGVADPLSEPVPEVVEADARASDNVHDGSDDNNIITIIEVASDDPGASNSKPKKGDPLHAILERQAAAIEAVALGMGEMAEALREIAAALQANAARK